MEILGEEPRSGYSLAYQRRAGATLEAVRKAAPPGGRILDVAAAQGNFTLKLAEAGYRLTWNDLRPELADYVAEKHTHGEVDYCPGNIFDIDFSCKFDVVLATEVIEHVAHPDDFLRRLAELLNPGGHIVLSTPNGSYWRNTLPRFSDCEDPAAFELHQFKPDADGHIFLLEIDEIYALSSAAGLRVSHVELFANSLTNGHVKLEPALRILPLKAVQRLEHLTSGPPDRLRRKINVQALAILVNEN